MSREQYDVIVIGGGISGLCAARKLVQNGKKVLVLEARNRVGGRTYTEYVELDNTKEKVKVDLGGMWLGYTQHRLKALVEEQGLKYYVTYHQGKHLQELSGKISNYTGLIPSMSLISLLDLDAKLKLINNTAKKIDTADPFSSVASQQMDNENVRAFIDKKFWTKESIATIEIATRIVFGAEPEDISLLYFMHYVASAGSFEDLTEIEKGGQMYLLEDGIQAVTDKLAKSLGDKVKLNHPVQRVEYSQDSVTVISKDGSTFTAKKAILALAPSMCSSIEFSPTLPPLRVQLQQRMPMGSILKFYIFFDKPWWREAGFSGQMVSDVGPASYIADGYYPPEFTPSTTGPYFGSKSKPPYLVGFIISKHLHLWGEKSKDQRRAAIEQQIKRIFGKMDKSIGYAELDWRTEQYSGGCYVGIAGPGIMTKFGSALKKPVGPLHFAGTETSQNWCGYIEGGIEAGERAANEILGINSNFTKITNLQSPKSSASFYWALVVCLAAALCWAWIKYF